MSIACLFHQFKEFLTKSGFANNVRQNLRQFFNVIDIEINILFRVTAFTHRYTWCFTMSLEIKVNNEAIGSAVLGLTLFNRTSAPLRNEFHNRSAAHFGFFSGENIFIITVTQKLDCN